MLSRRDISRLVFNKVLSC